MRDIYIYIWRDIYDFYVEIFLHDTRNIKLYNQNLKYH